VTRTTRGSVVLALACLAGCGGGRVVPLYESRVAIGPLRERLRQAGGDPARILHPASPRDFEALVAGKRYKFVVDSEGRLAVAPLPAEVPSNEYVHPILADGGPVRSAGGLRVERDARGLTRVTVDQDSKAYCPGPESLSEALRSLRAAGVDAGALRVENRPPDCAGSAGSGRARYGALMTDVGQRFERLGRGARAGRYEIAALEAREIEAIFASDLPRAEPPAGARSANLPELAEAFSKTELPLLEGALKASDAVAIRAAFARTAEGCNRCHRASDSAFVEVPSQTGQEIPVLTPLR
jgi:hypothetical protein